MGNSFSNGNNLYIHLDKPYYSPGDAVHGHVLLNCVLPFQAAALVLKVEGYEKTHWNEHHTNRRYCEHSKSWVEDSVVHRRSGTRDMFHITVPLYTYSHTVQPGQYQFPFSCVLPTNLPGSLELKNHSGHYNGHSRTDIVGKIRYAVRAECQVPGMFKPNIRFKQHITVHERMPKPPSQILLQDHQKVTACCCCTQGHVFVTAHVEKDQYFPGEMASAFLEIDNQSSVEFSAVALELHCHLTLRSGDGHLHENYTKVAYCSVPGVKPGEQQLKENARRVSLQLPTQLLSSANGQLVQCNYTLAIRLQAPIHVSDPTVKLPITIYQAVPQYHEFAAPPPYWTPVVMGTPVQLSLPCAPPVPPLGQVMGVPAEDTQPLLQPGMPGHSHMQMGAKSGWLAGQV